MMPNEIIHYKKPKELETYRVIAVDASDIVQKGALKKTWHLHYGIDLFSLTCDQFKLTDIDFSPSWNIRTEPKYMERDETGTLFNLYDAASK